MLTPRALVHIGIITVSLNPPESRACAESFADHGASLLTLEWWNGVYTLVR